MTPSVRMGRHASRIAHRGSLRRRDMSLNRVRLRAAPRRLANRTIGARVAECRLDTLL